MEYKECKFCKRRTISNIEVRNEHYIIPHFIRFRKALEAYDFRIGRSKMEYKECKFCKRRTISNIEGARWSSSYFGKDGRIVPFVVSTSMEEISRILYKKSRSNGSWSNS
ncbi:hypothetical protein Lal_00012931 [Lupinus albus]|nr:hypothetical protein Lal_00012931 [Lupinus albus]